MLAAGFLQPYVPQDALGDTDDAVRVFRPCVLGSAVDRAQLFRLCVLGCTVGDAQLFRSCALVYTDVAVRVSPPCFPGSIQLFRSCSLGSIVVGTLVASAGTGRLSAFLLQYSYRVRSS